MLRTPRRPTSSRAPFESYLYEIDQTPLLTADEEHQLAARIALGDVEARDHLARANLRLVVRIARQYAGRGLSLEDLIAEGNVGLLRAVEGYDPDAGTRFSTYAAFWVKQSIRVALNKSGHAVRLPQYMGTLMAKWRRTEAELRDRLGREPDREEVAARLGLSAKQARAVAKAQKAVASGQAITDEADQAELVADGRETAPGDGLAAAEELREILASLGELGEREATVLRMRFGLGGSEPATLQEVGVKLGLTRERVRQIERDSLALLRDRLTA